MTDLSYVNAASLAKSIEAENTARVRAILATGKVSLEELQRLGTMVRVEALIDDLGRYVSDKFEVSFEQQMAAALDNIYEQLTALADAEMSERVSGGES